jgi:FlaA1/EpsC-like NDP-sugar epimerase
MKYKTILLIGGSGFFGKSILDYFLRNTYLNKKIKKIIILSRKNINSKITTQIKKNYKFNKVFNIQAILNMIKNKELKLQLVDKYITKISIHKI